MEESPLCDLACREAKTALVLAAFSFIVAAVAPLLHLPDLPVRLVIRY